MDIDRRHLMKGLLAGGALLALGTPPWTFAEPPIRKAKPALLFFGDHAVNEAFAWGVRATCAEAGLDGLKTVSIEGGLLSKPDTVIALMEQSRGTRWVAVLDDAGAAVFQELARASGGRMLLVGSHADAEGDRYPLRHVWLAASRDQGVGGRLASDLSRSGRSFSISESFVSGSPSAGDLLGWSASGFVSYRSATSDLTHLHCSGVSLSEGCEILSLGDSEGWKPIPPQNCRQETPAGQSNEWVEAVGRAVTAAALGVNTVQESCSSRAFIHRAPHGNQALSRVRFVSCVMDL